MKRSKLAIACVLLAGGALWAHDVKLIPVGDDALLPLAMADEHVRVTPGALDFGEVAVGQSRTLSLQVENLSLQVQSVSVSVAGGGGAVSVGEPAFELAAGAPAHSVELTCVPSDGGLLAASVTVRASDPRGYVQSAEVALSGVAVVSAPSPPETALHRNGVGVVDATGEVRLQFDHDGGTLGHNYKIQTNNSGAPGYLPVAGRWDSDTTESVGLFLPGGATFLLRSAQSSGPPTQVFAFFAEGAPAGALYPLMGDWDGDGLASAGIFDQTTGRVWLKNANGTAAPVVHAFHLPDVAGSSWYPIGGDWNGDGRDQLGLLNRSPLAVRLFDDLPATTFMEYPLPPVTGEELWPLSGDWHAAGRDGVGVYDPQTGTFWLLGSVAQAAEWDRVFQLGGAGWLPVAGSWDGDSFRYEAPRTAGGRRPSAFPQLIETGAGGQHLYFSAPSEELGSHQSIYYNVRGGPHLYSNADWQLNPSIEILGTAGAAALGVVLSAEVPTFRHPDGTLYERLMVLVVEHPQPDEFAGWVCISYGSSPTDWTPPLFVTADPDAAPRPCEDPYGGPPPRPDIPAELVSGFRYGDTLVFGVMNGDVPQLTQDALAGRLRTQTYLYTTTIEQPWRWMGHGEFLDSVVTPNTGGRWVYDYGINLDLSYDELEGAVYWSRSYPYPFDLGGSIPCQNDGSCPSGVSQNPNRFQTYRVVPCPGAGEGTAPCQTAPPTGAVGDPDFTTFHQLPWTFVFDGGAAIGYPSDSGQGCGPTALTAGYQTGFLGLDINSVTFVKDGNGWIARDPDGKRTLVFGGTAVKDKANGECDFADGSVYLWREP